MAKTIRVSDQYEAEERISIKDFYLRRLTARPPDYDWAYPPVVLGPTWTQDDRGYFILPDRTIGWEMLTWCGLWLQLASGSPWVFTDEQARWILWWYSLDREGNFNYQDGVLQRVKGWGKDPVGACLLLFEMLGECRFDRWRDSKKRLDPVGKDVPDAWVQTAAVALDQTKNTMRLLPNLVSDAAKSKYRIQIGKEQAYALNDQRFLQAVTSAPRTLQGNRGTFLLLNETHEWDSRNEGHEMAAVIASNATKSPDGASRTLRITNAYEPGKDSVAERDREAWEKMQNGETTDIGFLYDSLEAGVEAPLTAEAAPLVVPSIIGDSHWLSIKRIVNEILDPRTPPSRKRRYWYNQIWAAEDAWCIPQWWDEIADKELALLEGEQVVLFLDCSTTDDATGLVACRVSDGAIFTLGVWPRPKGVAEWSVPRPQVDAMVRRAFHLQDVVAFFGDPGSGKDELGLRYWDSLYDDWSREFGENLAVWAVQSGPKRHAIEWNMSSSERQNLFAQACERVLSEIELKLFRHDSHPILREHVRNARRMPTAGGVSISKEHRESPRKIDLAVCMVGARMLRRLYLGLDASKRRRVKTGKHMFA